MKKLIMEILKKLNEWKFILLVIFIVVGCFYWYELRPSIIYSRCNNEAIKETDEILGSYEYSGAGRDLYNIKYSVCLRSKGVNN